MNVTRRDMGKMAIAALPLSRLLAKPNSKFGGVQVGINAPYSFQRMPGTADDILKYMLQLGLNGIELRSQPVEGFLGAPVVPQAAGRGRAPLTAEQEAARKQAADDLQKWRLALSMDRREDLSKEVRRRGHSDRYRQVRRHRHDARRRGGLLLQPGEGARRASSLVRDSGQPHQATRRVRRQAQDDGRLPRTRKRHRPGGVRQAGELGDRHVVCEIQWRERGHRALHRGEQFLARRMDQETP